MRCRDHFERRAPTVEREPQCLAGDRGQDAACRRIAALADNIHLDVIDALGDDQVQVSHLARFMFAARDRNQVELLRASVRFMIVGRQRFFEPRDTILGHLFGDAVHSGVKIVSIAHAPPCVGVHHEIEVGSDGIAHLSQHFDVLFRSHAGTHLVGSEPELRYRGGFRGVLIRRHIHPGGAIEMDAVANTSSDQFRYGQVQAFAERIVQGDFDGTVDFGESRDRVRPNS